MRPGTFTLHHVHVLEQDGGFSPATSVVVEDGVVTAVAAGARGPAGAPEYDLSGLWLMPGVFDCHGHVGLSTVDSGELLRTPESYAVLEAAVNLRRTLRRRRDLRARSREHRRRRQEGRRRRPRQRPRTCTSRSAFSARPAATATCTPAASVSQPDPLWRFLMTTVDGVENMRLEVRRLLRDGADCIKLCTSGGVVSPHDTPFDESFTREEIAVAVAEASRRRRPVAVHATGGRGHRQRGGRRGARPLSTARCSPRSRPPPWPPPGCWLVPTLSVLRELIDDAEKAGRRRLRAVVRAAQDPGASRPASATACAWRARPACASRPAATGSTGASTAGTWRSWRCCTSAACRPRRSCSRRPPRGAELCGVGDRLGRLAPGYVFDAVVLGADPSDMAVFRRRETVLEVLKQGVPCRTGAALLAERGAGDEKEG